MRKITQEEFDAFPRNRYGVKICPSGNYSAIRVFPERCSFAKGCSFAEGCSFAKWCSFAERCSFAEGCSFAERCSFAEWCSFAKWCSFAEWCSFAKWCSFENGHIPVSCNRPFVGIDRIGSEDRKAYFWNFTDGLYVRAGCFFGAVGEFIEKLKRDNDPKKTREYLMALDLAKVMHGLQNEVNNGT